MKQQLTGWVQWMDGHQVWLYLFGLGLGATVGLSAPVVAPMAETAIMPLLGFLLYATFLGLPFHQLSAAFKDWRFMGSTFVLNFLLVPIVVWMLSNFVAHDHVVLVGVFFVLLTPCIDYVIVFAGLAKGDSRSLLAAAPALMILQMVLLPVYLWFFVGDEFIDSVELAPFAEAFVWIILVPLLLAVLTQVSWFH